MLNLADKKHRTALHYAVEMGEIDYVTKLIEAGADPNKRDLENNSTSLMAAAILGHTDCVKQLIRAGADLNIQTNNGQTALILATKQKSCVTALFRAGAEVNATFLAAIVKDKPLAMGKTFEFFHYSSLMK